MTRRALVAGLLMAAWISVWPAYSSMIVRSSRADYAHLSLAFLIPFVFLLGLNLLPGLRRFALTATELLTICCIGMLAANMQGEWLAGYFLGIITAPSYFATPENRWDELLLSRLPTWVHVASRGAAIGFYEGLAEGEGLPWRYWVAPLAWWVAFLAALLMASFSAMVILRKQWMEHERLAYPVATALLELTGAERGAGVGLLVRSRLFQVGFLVSG